MSVLDNVGGGISAATGKPDTLPASDDALIATLIDETEYKTKGSDVVDTAAVYPDFEPPTPPAYEPEPWPTDGAPADTMPGVDALGTDGEKVLLSLATLPTETIVDAVDVTLTEVIIRSCKLEDYEGKDEDKMLTSAADRAALITATERYLESQSIKVTPLTGLLVTVGLVYGKKFMYGVKLKKLMAKTASMESELAALRDENARLAAELRNGGPEGVDDEEITDAVWYETK